MFTQIVYSVIIIGIMWLIMIGVLWLPITKHDQWELFESPVIDRKTFNLF